MMFQSSIVATAALAAAILCPPASAQETAVLPFPLEVESFDELAREVRLEANAARLWRLRGEERAVLAGVLLPDGAMVDLELEREDLARFGFGIRLNGAPAPELLERSGLQVWRGRVEGEPESDVFLSFSRYGSRGWIERRGDYVHLLAGPDEGGDWSQAVALWVSEATLVARGQTLGDYCAGALPVPGRGGEPTVVPGDLGAVTGALLEFRVSVETDYQYYQKFNDPSAQAAYTASLLAAVSMRYEEQVNMVLTYPYLQFYTTPVDPWLSQDIGGDCLDVLNEFQTRWAGNIPNGGHVGHFLSGANLGCGVAYLDVLCDDVFGFSVSGNLNGRLSFPVMPGPLTWDFVVMAHELGHNVGTPHTHDYCPPLDECAPSGYFGQCQSQRQCTNQGTVMSYCHLCSGGMNNITTYFHPTVVNRMRVRAEASCLPDYCGDPLAYCTAKTNSQGCLPAVGWSGHPTLSGLDDFVVTAEQVINNKNGIHFWGFAAASAPFQDGTLCVQPPLTRTPVLGSGGNPSPPSDCSGVFAFPWTHDYMTARGLSAGTTVFCQFWYRDPGSPSGTGLSDALEFTVCD